MFCYDIGIVVDLCNIELVTTSLCDESFYRVKSIRNYQVVLFKKQIKRYISL